MIDYTTYAKIARIESLLIEIRALLKDRKDPSEKGTQPDYRPTPPTGPVSAKPGGYYQCPKCLSREPMKSLSCNVKGCPDGRVTQYRSET